jgi:putative colanic acid biosynthesis acetyltransferase WcaF
MHRWRAWLLRLFGASVHHTAHIYPSARIWAPWNLTVDEGGCIADAVDVYSVAPIQIGAFSTVSQYSYLCAASHEYEDVSHRLLPAPIVIGRRCWLAADVFVGPGVTIHDGAVIGARSSVFKDIPAWTIASGAPARAIRPRRLQPADFGEDDPVTPSESHSTV